MSSSILLRRERSDVDSKKTYHTKSFDEREDKISRTS